ncbi:MAG: hypothetical protein KA151_08940 [Piscinibacter sp.]|jgi:hypothetical protein|nr:hypothetical protein [Piscinibacter sp.]
MAHLRPAHCGLVIAALLSGAALAKLPPPSEEAKAKAAEAAAKTAWAGKVEAYRLCQAQDAVAASYYAAAKKEGKDVKPPVATPPCTDPGAFVPPVPAAPEAAGAHSAPANKP